MSFLSGKSLNMEEIASSNRTLKYGLELTIKEIKYLRLLSVELAGYCSIGMRLAMS